MRCCGQIFPSLQLYIRRFPNDTEHRVLILAINERCLHRFFSARAVSDCGYTIILMCRYAGKFCTLPVGGKYPIICRRYSQSYKCMNARRRCMFIVCCYASCSDDIYSYCRLIVGNYFIVTSEAVMLYH